MTGWQHSFKTLPASRVYKASRSSACGLFSLQNRRLLYSGESLFGAASWSALTMELRLAAILAADVEGYSRLTELDEEGSTTTLRAYCAVEEEAISRIAVTSSVAQGTASSPSFPASSRPFAAPSRFSTRSTNATRRLPRAAGCSSALASISAM